jgi:hypothetical protein
VEIAQTQSVVVADMPKGATTGIDLWYLGSLSRPYKELTRKLTHQDRRTQEIRCQQQPSFLSSLSTFVAREKRMFNARFCSTNSR